ncbi:MAG: DUF2062 domain-containing protein [Candidatus Omnitrophica bacterium]|nr:DUF2062 domain-containing protein [Candidatus Omnitrophota bacterium]
MFGKNVLTRSGRYLIDKLIKINDTPQKISLGVALGVFAGFLPGTGPAAALFLAFIFKANRAAAFLGGLLTNTWLSIITFVLAIKVGSVILNTDWRNVQYQVRSLFHDFTWANLFKLSVIEVILPVALGYLIIGIFLGTVSYFISLAIIRRNFHGD